MYPAHNALSGELLQRLRVALHNRGCFVAIEQALGSECSGSGWGLLERYALIGFLNRI